jgi:hypothetical protein
VNKRVAGVVEGKIIKVSVDQRVLAVTLKRLLPHKGIVRKTPLVTLIADGLALDLVGQFDNTWSIPANVSTAGSCTVDIKTLLTCLKTYDQEVPISFELSHDGLKFGTTKVKLHKIK